MYIDQELNFEVLTKLNTYTHWKGLRQFLRYVDVIQPISSNSVSYN